MTTLCIFAQDFMDKGLTAVGNGRGVNVFLTIQPRRVRQFHR